MRLDEIVIPPLPPLGVTLDPGNPDNVACLNGRWYSLTATHVPTLDDQQREVGRQMLYETIASLEAYRRQLTRVKDNLDLLSRQALQQQGLPPLNRAHVQAGLCVWLASEGVYGVQNTLQYFPQYVKMTDVVRALVPGQIAPRRVTGVCYWTLDTMNLIDFALYNLNGARFLHYHSISSSEDCVGDLASTKPRTYDEILAAYQLWEQQLTTVNRDSIGTYGPPNLPQVDALVMIPEQEEMAWTIPAEPSF